MNYVFGDIGRLAPYRWTGEVEYKVLSWRNVFKISDNDVLFVTRVWSPLVTIFYLKKNRPKIIQFADGLITESNCTKKINRRPQFLYEKIHADILYVRQPKWSLPYFIDKKNVRSIVEYSNKNVTKKISSVTFVFGNDPLVGNSYENILKDIEYINHVIDLPVHISSGNVVFSKSIMKKFEKINSVGSASNIASNDDSTLVVTTPSTAGYDMMLNGFAVMTFPSSNCQTMSMLFSKFEINSIDTDEEGTYVSCRVPNDISLIKSSASLPKKHENLKKWNFKEFILQVRYFVGDILCLIK